MFRVANIFIHPDYRGIQDAIISDIALLRTTLPFQFSNRVRPISLGNNLPVNTNERVTFTGDYAYFLVDFFGMCLMTKKMIYYLNEM